MQPYFSAAVSRNVDGWRLFAGPSRNEGIAGMNALTDLPKTPVTRKSRLREGLPFPLGATWNGLGVNFVTVLGECGESGAVRWTPIVRQPEPSSKV